MKHDQSFAVSRFENRNGVTSWRIDGASMASASAATSRPKKRLRLPPEKAALEMKAMQSESGMQSVTTFLAADQFRETEAVFRRLAGRPRPLSFYVEFALANYREPVTQKLLTEAVTAYVATNQHEHEQDLLSEPHLTRMKRDLKRLEKHFPGAAVAELTGARRAISRHAKRRSRPTTTAGASSRPSSSSRNNAIGSPTIRSIKSRSGAFAVGAVAR